MTGNAQFDYQLLAKQYRERTREFSRKAAMTAFLSFVNSPMSRYIRHCDLHRKTEHTE